MLGLWETWAQLNKACAVGTEETQAVAQVRKLSVVGEVLCSESLFAARHRPHSWSSEGLGRPLSCLWGQQGVSLKQRGPRESPIWLQDSRGTRSGVSSLSSLLFQHHSAFWNLLSGGELPACPAPPFQAVDAAQDSVMCPPRLP